MKIIRYQDKQGLVGYAAQLDDGAAMKLRGDIYSGSLATTDEAAHIARLLAQVAPTGIINLTENLIRTASFHHGLYVRNEFGK